MNPEPLERRITLTDMVAYAGATWDWHRLHYDAAFLEGKGLAAPVVDGQMLGALMAEQILDGLGSGAQLAAMEIRYRAMMFAEETVIISSEPRDDHTFLQIAKVGDRVVAEATTRVRRG